MRLKVAWLATLLLCLGWNYNRLLDYSPHRDQRYVGNWDENHYYAWARSLIHDGDVDFGNDFAYVAHMRGMGSTQKHFEQALQSAPRTKTGHFPNKYGIGLAILSLPLLGVARILASIRQILFGEIVSSFASIYILFFAWTSVIVGFLGLAASFRVLTARTDRRTAAWTVILGTIGLPILFYIWFNPWMAHAAGFGVGCMFVLASRGWWETLAAGIKKEKTAANVCAAALCAGLLLGLCAIIRYPDVLLGLFAPVLAGNAWFRSSPASRKTASRLLLMSGVTFGLGFALAASPQLLAWKKLYGEWVIDSYSAEPMYGWPVNALKILLGDRNSLLLWSPIALFGVLGLVVGILRRDVLCFAGLLVFLGFIWVYGSWGFYWLGASFGMRGFTDTGIVFFLGISQLLDWIQSMRSGRLRWFRAIALCLLVLSASWNLWMICAQRSGVQGGEEPFQGKRLILESGRIVKGVAGEDFEYLYHFSARKYPLFTPYGNVVEGM
jgi:hypothetical protein